MRSNNFKREDFNQTISLSYVYSHFRIRDSSGLTKCSVDYVAFKGELVTTSSTVTTNTGPFELQISDGFQSQIIPNAVTYTDSATPTINTVLPKTGHVLGGYNITLTGTNLQGTNIIVNIDSVPCLIVLSNSTNIICQVQERP